MAADFLAAQSGHIVCAQKSHLGERRVVYFAHIIIYLHGAGDLCSLKPTSFSSLGWQISLTVAPPPRIVTVNYCNSALTIGFACPGGIYEVEGPISVRNSRPYGESCYFIEDSKAIGCACVIRDHGLGTCRDDLIEKASLVLSHLYTTQQPSMFWKVCAYKFPVNPLGLVREHPRGLVSAWRGFVASYIVTKHISP